MTIRFVSLAVAGCAIATARAETVAWWRFDDKPVGSVTAETDVFANAVDASVFPAHPAVFYTTAATKSYEPELMPVVSNFTGESERLLVEDPISKTTHASASAMYCPWAGNGSNKNGGVWIENDPRLLGQKGDGSGDFTFECFFRTTETGIARTSKMEGIAGQMGNGQGTWDLMLFNGELWTRVSCTNAVGEQAANQFAGTNAAVSPNVWHHAAITFSTNGTYCLFLDYKLVANKQIGTAGKGPWYLAPKAATTPIYIAMSTYTNDRGFEGEIAEARISDECLTEASFLRIRSFGGDRQTADEDAYLWYSFDSAVSTNRSAFLEGCPNLISAETPYVEVLTAEGCSPAAFDGSEKADGRIRSSRNDTTAFGNDASLDLRRSSGQAASSYVCVRDQGGLTDGDFTEEFFFKLDQEFQVSQQYSDLFKSSWLKVMVDRTDGCFYLRVFGTSLDGRSTDLGKCGSNCLDGQWHHLAFTWDKSASTLTCYLDYAPIGSRYYVPNKGSDHLIGKATDRGTAQDSSSLIDELRIVRRVLDPSEFMHLGVFSATALAYIPFNGDMRMRGTGYLPVEIDRNSTVAGYSVPVVTEAAAYTVVSLNDGVTPDAEDTGSLALDGGSLRYPSVPALRRSNVTVEFFCRFKGVSACRAGVLGLTNGGNDLGVDNSVGGIFWRFAMNHSNWTDASLKFFFCTTNAAVGGATVEQGLTVSPDYTFVGTRTGDKEYWPADYDDRWHHVAVTMESVGTAEAPQTRVTAYWDRRQQATTTVNGELRLFDTATLAFGRNAMYTQRKVPCDIDELRVSAGILTPKQFIRKPSAGLLLIVR